MEIENLKNTLEEDKNNQEDSSYIKLDYTIEEPKDRVALVERIVAETPSERLTPLYLSKLSDYIISAQTREEKKQKKILTDNRMVTINRNETSFEGLVGKMTGDDSNSPDSIYNMITEDKNIIMRPKSSITEKDIAEIPELASLRKDIEKLEERFSHSRGKRAYLLKKQLIDLRKDQYEIRKCYQKPINSLNLTKSTTKLDLGEKITMDENGNISSTGIINFFDIDHVSALLCNYSRIVEDNWTNFAGDGKWLMMDFTKLVDATLEKDYPIYYAIVIYKIDGKSNLEIQRLLEEEFGVKHSVEYISSLWRNKIPKLIVEEAQNEWLYFHYTSEVCGKWKKCNRCEKIKPAHNNFFSKNKTSRDGWYSICKECRNKK